MMIENYMKIYNYESHDVKNLFWKPRTSVLRGNRNGFKNRQEKYPECNRIPI